MPTSPELPGIATYKIAFDGVRWTREGFDQDGHLVDFAQWKPGEPPIIPGTAAPLYEDIRLSNGESRGRNGWFRAARALVRAHRLSGLPEVSLDVFGLRRDTRMPPISVGLSRRDAEALGHALIAVATAPSAPQPQGAPPHKVSTPRSSPIG